MSTLTIVPVTFRAAAEFVTYTQADESGASLTAAGWVKVRDLPPRKGWAESSVALRALRDPVGSGGVQRCLWEKGAAS